MTKWLGPSDCCDVCGGSFNSVLYDSRTVMGPWATMCHACWREYGMGRLGTGLGQKYRKQEDGSFRKIEG